MDYNYNYDLNGIDNIPSSFWAGFAAIMGIIILIGIAISVVIIIAQWKMFKKGNQPGWAAIIPVYNQIVQCNMVGVNPLWILIVFIAGLIAGIPVVGSIISLAASIYFMILLNVSTARAFGKEDSFAIGLILLPIVFYPILGFGSAQYVGSDKAMNDFIFKKAKEVVNNNSSKFCPHCGAKMNKDSKFCPTCGKEVE